MGTTTVPSIDRASLRDWYVSNRRRSEALFDLLAPEAYYSQPIALRHPIVFYEGHLPGFSFNTLVKRGLGRPSIDARLEQLFARGIDPHESQAGGGASGLEATRAQWPSRDTVRQFAAEADRQVLDAIAHGDIDQPGHPLLDRAEAAFSILEHEAMHQETLLYMWHRLPFDQKRRPPGYRPATAGAVPEQAWVQVPPGRATLGIDRGQRPFTWDNERPALAVEVPAFSIQQHDVTNADFLAFVEAGGYTDARFWSGDDFAWVQSTGLAHPTFWERGPDDTWLWPATRLSSRSARRRRSRPSTPGTTGSLRSRGTARRRYQSTPSRSRPGRARPRHWRQRDGSRRARGPSSRSRTRRATDLAAPHPTGRGARRQGCRRRRAGIPLPWAGAGPSTPHRLGLRPGSRTPATPAAVAPGRTCPATTRRRRMRAPRRWDA